MKARIAVSIAATLGCVGLIAGATYAVTVLEWVMPASNLQLGYAAALEYSSRTAELSALDAQAKASHESAHEPAADDAGPAGGGGLPGNVDDQPASVRKLASIYGLFTVSDGRSIQRFPYSIVPDMFDRDHRAPVTHDRLKRFHARAPGYFDYTDSDWKLEGCKSFLTPSTGISSVDVRLRLGSSDVCIVRWLKQPQATMLIGGVVAEGGRWMRFLITPICRLMSSGWLEELAEQGGKADYVACALIFDPERPAGGPRDVLDRRVYQVTGKGLAVIR
ncbi:MAG: hypothetical protein K2Y27_25280 [Xanthobacteraceae bacterium]|nr:hypothetical protein [Xanthobacteraceae bacterium]